MIVLFLRYILIVMAIVVAVHDCTADLRRPQASSVAVPGVPFIENHGQFHPLVRFHARTFAGALNVTDTGLVHLLTQHSGEHGIALVEYPVLSNRLSPKGVMRASTVVSFLRGEKDSWRTNIPTFKTVDVGEPWPGVTLSVVSSGANVEKILTVAAGVDTQPIVFAFDGATRLRVDEKTGELVVDTTLGAARFSAPVAYQTIGSQRVAVEVSYVLHGEQSYGFSMGEYDRSYELIIDPILAATYIGGSAADKVNSLEILANGDVLVAGQTASNDLIVSGGVFQAAFAGSIDLFVYKLNANLSDLLVATYLGGTGSDTGGYIAVDASENVYIAGSSDGNFPIGGAVGFDTSNNGSSDVVLAKLDSTLSTLLGSTYLGSSDSDTGTGIALDSNGNVYVIGAGFSGFPTTFSAWNPVSAGGVDGFVSKLSPDLSELLASTVISSVDQDAAKGISISLDPGGATESVFVVGTADQPIDMGMGGILIAYDPLHNGGSDVWVASFNTSLGSLKSFTYLGGAGNDIGEALHVPPEGDVYVTGYAGSGYPTTVGAYQGAPGSTSDAVVSWLARDLRTLPASTFVGGTNREEGYAIRVSASGTVHIAGVAVGIPNPGDTILLPPSPNGFAAALTGDLTSLIELVTIGGTGDDLLRALRFDPSGNVYVGGEAESGLPGTTGGAFSIYGGGGDGYVAKLGAFVGTPTATPSSTPTLTATPTPTVTATPTPTATPASEPGMVPQPTASATPTPTLTVTESPTIVPTLAPPVCLRLDLTSCQCPPETVVEVIRGGEEVGCRREAEAVYAGKAGIEPPKVAEVIPQGKAYLVTVNLPEMADRKKTVVTPQQLKRLASLLAKNGLRGTASMAKALASATRVYSLDIKRSKASVSRVNVGRGQLSRLQGRRNSISVRLGAGTYSLSYSVGITVRVKGKQFLLGSTKVSAPTLLQLGN